MLTVRKVGSIIKELIQEMEQYLKDTQPHYYPPVENLLDLVYEHYTENNSIAPENTVAGKAAKEKEKELETWLRGLPRMDEMVEDYGIDIPLWEKIMDQQGSVCCAWEKTAFEEGMKVGIRLMMEAMKYVNLSCPACGKTMVHKRRKIAAYWVDAESIEDTKERQGLAIYGVGKMRCSDKDCTEELYEVAIEQGFMEMLYRLKRDYEENKEQSELAVKYRECQREPEDHSGRILELRELLQKLEQECKRLMKKQMEAQKQMTERERVYLQESLQESIRDGSIQMDNIMEGMDQQRVDSVYTPAAGSAEAMYNELLKDILKRKEELENELHILEEGSEGGIILKRRYEYFMEELLALPERNSYGQKLIVHGLDDREPQWTEDGVFLSTPDMLTFSRELYAVTIEAGRVDGDVIHYRTIYGMEFTAFGARRTIKDFKDYRVYGKDGKPKFAENEAEILGEPVQVEYRKRRNGKKI